MKIAEGVRNLMWHLLQKESPKEVCGVLISQYGDDTYDWLIPLPNYSPQPTKEFWMNPQEVMFAIGEHVGKAATWHSHPTSRWDQSHADRFLMRFTGIPMAIVACIPYPSVSLYELTSYGIVLTQRYQIEEEDHHATDTQAPLDALQHRADQ